MKKCILSVLTILSISGYPVMAPQKPGMTEQRMSPACALAVAAALENLRAWYADGHAEEPISFETYLEQQYTFVICSESEGRRISVALGQTSRRGGGVWYSIDADSFEIIERVFGR